MYRTSTIRFDVAPSLGIFNKSGDEWKWIASTIIQSTGGGRSAIVGVVIGNILSRQTKVVQTLLDIAKDKAWGYMIKQ